MTVAQEKRLATEIDRNKLLAHLRELVEPWIGACLHLERQGETRIARGAAVLTPQAEERISQLQAAQRCAPSCNTDGRRALP